MVTTLDKTETLYNRDDAIEKCSDRISFATLIPTTYTDQTQQREVNLPPTFETPKAAILRAHVKSQYAMTVIINTTQKLNFLTQSNT
jgi:hypothetical protein